MRIRTVIREATVLASTLVVVFSIHWSTEPAVGREPASPEGQAQTRKPAWLAGSGKDMRIKVAGKVLGENGTPAKDWQFEVRLETRFGERRLPATVDGNRFEFWVPVGGAGWFTLRVNATSADGRQIVRETIHSCELRQAAIEAVTLRMKKPDRFVEVTVVDNGRPVSDASVAAEFAGDRITAKTNDRGVATFAVMSRDKLSQLTAWTDDFRIGGYSLDRGRPRDPTAGKYTIELEKCRSQTIRLINDADKKPVPDLAFALTVGTGEPDYQSLGKTPDCEMKTDKNGEAVYRRFPDWKKHGCYVEMRDEHWIKAADEEMVDGAMVIRLRKSQFDKRRRVAGRITSASGDVAGFAVGMESFQGEEKNTVDLLQAFTDERGTFFVDYLPGATYCIYLDDARFASKIIDVTPYEPTTGKTSGPSLAVLPGQPVEIVATSGAAMRPIAGQYVHLSTRHEFSWVENGETQNGCGGRRWWAITDEQGKAQTFALPGEVIEGSIYTPDWRTEESVQVKAGGITRLEFHRRVAAKRKIAGRLLLTGGVEAALKDAVVEIGSLDGETDGRLTLKARPDGTFDFESLSSRIGVYARTKDAKAAAVSIIDGLDGPIEVRLKPTGEYRGQLFGKEDHPLKGHAVRASLSISAKGGRSRFGPTSFFAATFACKTDDEGKYTLTGLPYEVALTLQADSIDGSGQADYLTKFYLVPNEVRPPAVSHLWRKPARRVSFAERYAKTIRDCRLSHFHAMLILFRPTDDAKRFVDTNLVAYGKTPEVTSFIQIQGYVGDEPTNAEVVEFGQARNWPMPAEGKVFACAIDATGKELGRIELDCKAADGPDSASRFVRQYAPKADDAKKKWDEAFATAKRTNRKVWVRISQRYCGPCFMLARWLDDHRETLERDYVLLKIDDCRDLYGDEVAKRLTGGGPFSIPFYAIFDSDARMLINSNSPIGNIGYPSGFDGKKHLRKMLSETRGKLTVEQIEELLASLSD
jgi:hypothetical protein